MAATLSTFETIDTKDALILTAFPTTGAAAPIAAHYLTRHLDLPLVGEVRLDGLDGLMAVEQGRATSAIRIYGGELVCKLDHGCPRVFLITTEIQLPNELLDEIADAILAWARSGEAHLVVALEGVAREDDEDEPKCLVASTDMAILQELDHLGVPGAGRAMVGGLSALLTLRGATNGVRTATLMVEARTEHPDGRAAAKLIEVLDRLLPDVPVDNKPLLEEAEELEQEIRRATRPAAGVVPGATPTTFI